MPILFANKVSNYKIEHPAHILRNGILTKDWKMSRTNSFLKNDPYVKYGRGKGFVTKISAP